MRRRGRHCALQILYQMDMQGRLDGASVTPEVLGEELKRFWASFEQVDDAERDFAERLVRGVAGALEGLDTAISGASHNWKLPRMAKVDRNVLRLASYEILHCPDIPKAASINEALEIAKRFSGGGDSTGFINGILDNIEPAGESAAICETGTGGSAAAGSEDSMD